MFKKASFYNYWIRYLGRTGRPFFKNTHSSYIRFLHFETSDLRFQTKNKLPISLLPSQQFRLGAINQLSNVIRLRLQMQMFLGQTALDARVERGHKTFLLERLRLLHQQVVRFQHLSATLAAEPVLPQVSFQRAVQSGRLYDAHVPLALRPHAVPHIAPRGRYRTAPLRVQRVQEATVTLLIPPRLTVHQVVQTDAVQRNCENGGRF